MSSSVYSFWVFLLLKLTLFTESPESLSGTFHCFGRCNIPRIFVLTICWIPIAYWPRLLIPLALWILSAPIASKTVMSFSPTLFSRCMIHVMACDSSIRAASAPFFPLATASPISYSCCSPLNVALSVLVAPPSFHSLEAFEDATSLTTNCWRKPLPPSFHLLLHQLENNQCYTYYFILI